MTPTPEEEHPYTTTTARIFYALRNLFVKKGSVFTARSLHLGPVVGAALLAVVFLGAVVYRLSKPIGSGAPKVDPAGEASAAERLKITREPGPEAKPVVPSHDELLRTLIGGVLAKGSKGGPGGPVPGSPGSSAPETGSPALAGRPPEAGTGLAMASYGAAPSAGAGCSAPPGDRYTAEKKRGDDTIDSTLAFERPRGAPETDAPTRKDYEYVRLLSGPIAPETAAPTDPSRRPESALGTDGTGSTSPLKAASLENADAPRASVAGQGPSLFQEVRARLLNRIDTSIPNAWVVAEIARTADVGGWRLKPGDRLIGRVALATPRRVALEFQRLIDTHGREYTVEAQAVDLIGATGLPAQAADAKLKRALLFANERGLDYVRALRGSVAVYNNPLQGDLRELQNKALIVEPNTEFYILFHQIQIQRVQTR